MEVVDHPKVELQVLGIAGYVGEIVEEVLERAGWHAFVADYILEG